MKAEPNVHQAYQEGKADADILLNRLGLSPRFVELLSLEMGITRKFHNRQFEHEGHEYCNGFCDRLDKAITE